MERLVAHAHLDAAYAPAAVAQWLSNARAAAFVAAFADGALVGYVHVGANALPCDAPPGTGELKWLYVCRSEQASGLAHRLWDAASDTHGSRAVARLRRVLVGQRAALKF